MYGMTDIITIIAMFVAAGGIYLAVACRQVNILFIILPVLMVLIAWVLLFPSSKPVGSDDIESGTLLLTHVIFFSFGIGALFLAFILGVLLILQDYCIKHKRVGRITEFLPSLQVLDRLMLRFILVGFPFITAGLVFGIILAHTSWTTLWIKDAKVIFSLICWVWYTLLLQFRLAFGWRGRRLALLNLFGFVVLVFTLFGVQMLFSGGSHRYL